MVRPVRKVGRPTKASKKGGKRPNAGKKKGPVDGLRKRGVEERVLKARRKMQVWDEYKIIRLAFISLTNLVLGPEAADCVEICTSSTETAVVKKAKLDAKQPKPISALEALTVLLHLGLTKFMYCEFSVMLNEAARIKIMPCYDQVRLSKALCRPDNGIEIHEHKATVNLQSLLYHTITRIVEAYGAEIDATLPAAPLLNECPCEFVATYGMDAATGQKEYKQRFEDPEKSDASLFAVVMNPISIKMSTGAPLWTNAVPQSPKNVRPLLLEFQKESLSYVISIHRRIMQQIRNLRPVYATTPAGHMIKVTAKFLLTLIDGKIFNILTKTKSNECPTCRAKSSQLGDPQFIGTRTFAPKGAGLKHGLQPMHAYIKVVTLLLKLAYFKPVHKLRERTGKPVPRAKAKELRAQRKREIQDAYKPLGLRIDFPAQFGSGNTLDGNTCRRLFLDCQFFARTLDIDEDIVERFRIVLICINNTRYKLNVTEYEDYCHRLFRDYHTRYNYFRMSPSVHKILIHGGEIQANLEIPVGAAGEGAAEAKHRERKRARDKNTRKTNRRDHMSDVLYRELDSSDPVVAKRILERCARFRRKDSEALALLPAEARKLLIIDDSGNPPTAPQNVMTDSISTDAPARTDDAVPGPSRNCRIATRSTTSTFAPAPTQPCDLEYDENDPEYEDVDYEANDYGTDYEDDDDSGEPMDVDKN